MERIMLRRAIYSAVVASLTGTLVACGGGGGGSSAASSTPAQSMATMPMTISDAPSDDWACVGVQVLSIALIPAGGGSPVPVWTAPSQAPYVNLVQLDQLGELLGNVSVPAGNYSGAVLTIAANPGDLLLTVANNPEAGFPVAGGTSIPADQIQIQGAQGASGSRTVAVNVDFVNTLTVTAGETNVALDIEFDLGHPAFIVAHTPPAADGATVFAVNFNGPVRHHPVYDITALLLRHTYGSVTGQSTTSITIDKDFPVYPATNPETAIESSIALNIDADSTNGTIVYDIDAGTRSVVYNFGSTSFGTRFVRVAARYQTDGTLTAVRVWVSMDFYKVWLSPEGHVLNVDPAAGTLTVTNEDGQPVQVAVGSSTDFYFRTPADAQTDANAIGQGQAFLSNLVRGFKVHVGSLNPMGVPMPASSIDIETAAFGGEISNASSGTNGGAAELTYTSDYLALNDNYSLTLPFIANGADNGFTDVNDVKTQITGFKWWYFTFPTLVNFGSTEIDDFVSVTTNAVSLGGSIGNLSAWGLSAARWGDGVSNDGSSGWHLNDAVLVPTPLPLGTVTTAPGTGTSFAMTVLGATNPVTVNLDTNTGSATLVYQINRSDGMVTVTPLNISPSGDGLGTLQAALQNGTIVKLWGVPQTGGTIGAYVLAYYTGTMPNM